MFKSTEIIDKSIDDQTHIAIRTEYGIHLDKKIFMVET